MKIKYEFATETVEVEVSEKDANIIVDLDRQEYNINHKETRRHCSLEAYNLDDAYLPSNVNVEREVLAGIEAEQLYTAIAKLDPTQQELIHSFFFDDITISQYAKDHGITQAAASQRKTTAMKKLKKMLE